MDADRLQHVTKRFLQLQGLALMPLAVLFGGSFAWRAGLFHLPADDQPHVAARWFFGLFAVALTASWVIGRRYARRFGRHTQRVRDSQLPSLLAGIACLPIGVAIQNSVPFSAPVALVGLVMGVFGILHYRLRRHYVAAAAVLLAFSMLRMSGISHDVRSALFDLTIGVVLAIVGIGDHRLLATTLMTTEPAGV